MTLIKRIGIILLVAFASSAFSQNGFIRGTVFDDATGEYLPGVTILLEGTTTGTITDLDGKFSLSVAPGVYNLRVSFISYETQNIQGIKVTQGKTTLLDNVRLKEASISLETVTIVATQVRNSETALLTVKRKSANVLDGISAFNLRKIGDSDAASSMKRVSGVSVEGGKYVFVRGLGDRYTKTTLNGVDIPGLDPDRNTLQMDIFPSSIIENLMVYKSFSADLPADFTGGVINIAVKDFPEELSGSVSVGLAYNSKNNFNNQWLTYKGGSTDFLGFDDGTRKIPAESNIPFFAEVVGNPTGAKGQRYSEILKSFSPVMAAQRQSSFIDNQMVFSLGNQWKGKKLTYGYNLAMSYKTNYDYYQDAEYGGYGLSSDKSQYELETRELKKGDYGVHNVLLSGLAGFAVKTSSSKYRINLLHLQNGESKAGIFNYIGSDKGSNFEGFQHNLDYSQRSMTNLLVDGKHHFSQSRIEAEWKLSPTYSKADEPDSRFTRYIYRGETLNISTESGLPERIWRNLREWNLSGVLNLSKDFDFNGLKNTIKAGGAYSYKNREFEIRKFSFIVSGVPLTGNPDELFYAENLWPRNGQGSKGTYFNADFLPINPNQFQANVSYYAGYISAELNPWNWVKAIVGVRAEKYRQRYTGRDITGDHQLNNTLVINDLDFFPTVNLIFPIAEKQNIRGSYSITIARPSFKEMSYAEIFDAISGRTFIGGLFRDANDLAGVEYWDGNLVTTSIQNFDLRYELFLNEGQMVSLSGFYKSFEKPIELVQYFSQKDTYQPRNVGDGKVLGVEFELRKNLGFAGESAKNFIFTTNVTVTKSEIELSKTEYDSRVLNARQGEVVGKYRDMAGQAPYIVNAGIAYNGSSTGFWGGLEAGVYYNVQGTTLQIAGIDDIPDVYNKPFHSLNLNANKSFGRDKRFQIGFKIDNILNSKSESIFRSFEATDQYYSRISSGVTFHARFAWTLFK